MKPIIDNNVIPFIEKVEREAWLDMCASAPESYVKSSNVSFTRVGSSIALANRGLPYHDFNRVLGIGIGPASEAELELALVWLKEHAAPSSPLQIPPHALSKKILEWMNTRGLERVGNGKAVFYRDSSPVQSHPIPTTLDIRLVGAPCAEDFGFTVHAGFGVPESNIPFFSALAGRPKWKTYVAYDGNKPVASAAMFIDNNWAYLGVASTLPEYRGRGAQNALFKRRITDGIAAGVIGFTGDTGQPLEGEEDAHKSYRNFHRAGFKRVLVRQNFILK